MHCFAQVGSFAPEIGMFLLWVTYCNQPLFDQRCRLHHTNTGPSVNTCESFTNLGTFGNFPRVLLMHPSESLCPVKPRVLELKEALNARGMLQRCGNARSKASENSGLLGRWLRILSITDNKKHCSVCCGTHVSLFDEISSHLTGVRVSRDTSRMKEYWNRQQRSFKWSILENNTNALQNMLNMLCLFLEIVKYFLLSYYTAEIIIVN